MSNIDDVMYDDNDPAIDIMKYESKFPDDINIMMEKEIRKRFYSMGDNGGYDHN